MKISVKMTPRDKTLLAILNVMLVVFLLGSLAVCPLHTTTVRLSRQVRRNEEQIAGMEKKEAELSEKRAELQRNQEKLDDIQETLFPMLRSQDIDELLTEKAARQGVHVLKLQIIMPEAPADIWAYRQGEEPGSNPDRLEGIYLAEVRLEVTGTEEAMDRLTDDLSENMPGIRVMSLTWGTDRQSKSGGPVYDRPLLVMGLQICMCRKENTDSTFLDGREDGTKGWQ